MAHIISQLAARPVPSQPPTPPNPLRSPYNRPPPHNTAPQQPGVGNMPPPANGNNPQAQGQQQPHNGPQWGAVPHQAVPNTPQQGMNHAPQGIAPPQQTAPNTPQLGMGNNQQQTAPTTPQHGLGNNQQRAQNYAPQGNAHPQQTVANTPQQGMGNNQQQAQNYTPQGNAPPQQTAPWRNLTPQQSVGNPYGGHPPNHCNTAAPPNTAPYPQSGWHGFPQTCIAEDFSNVGRSSLLGMPAAASPPLPTAPMHFAQLADPISQMVASTHQLLTLHAAQTHEILRHVARRRPLRKITRARPTLRLREVRAAVRKLDCEVRVLKDSVRSLSDTPPQDGMDGHSAQVFE
eukprot:GEMP01022320.1.p1 GENE.GEMP01022320.1~~GEMP01022320.1.p1  ORF type:complete len:345 (+),score=101.81 GEMP01022320.1:571-1605(+)